MKDLVFKPPTQSIDKSKYNELEPMIKMCDAISQLNNQSIYLYDYVQQKILYVSPHPLFLCGYKEEEVMEMGLSFHEKILDPEDLQMLIEINQMAWKFIYDTAPENRKFFCNSYDIYFRHKDGHKILVNHKTAPILFTDDGNIWISMCVVNYSSQKEAGNVVFARKDKKMYYNYNFEKKRFIPYLPEKLTKREEEILRLSMQGYNEKSIADKLHLSVRTVKNHRYNTEKKLGVNNLTNAVSVFNLIF